MIGLPDPERGEMVCAVVQPAEGQILAFDEIDTHSVREERVFEVGAVVLPRRENDDDRIAVEP